VGDVVFGVFFVCNSTILLLKSLFLKGERKWVMLCLVSFCLQLNYFITPVFFEKRKKMGDVMFGVFFFCLQLNYFIAQKFLLKGYERANRKVNLMKEALKVENA